MYGPNKFPTSKVAAHFRDIEGWTADLYSTPRVMESGLSLEQTPLKRRRPDEDASPSHSTRASDLEKGKAPLKRL